MVRAQTDLFLQAQALRSRSVAIRPLTPANADAAPISRLTHLPKPWRVPSRLARGVMLGLPLQRWLLVARCSPPQMWLGCTAQCVTPRTKDDTQAKLSRFAT
jgi:hypothetical protein